MTSFLRHAAKRALVHPVRHRLDVVAGADQEMAGRHAKRHPPSIHNLGEKPPKSAEKGAFNKLGKRKKGEKGVPTESLFFQGKNFRFSVRFGAQNGVYG